MKPSLGLVSQDPLDRAGCIVKSDNKVFPTRDDKRIVAGPVSHRIIMKPVLSAANERARIISTGSHRASDDLVHIPSLMHVAVLTDLQDNAFDVGSRVYFQEQAKFARINIVMEICYTYTAVVGDNIDRPI